MGTAETTTDVEFTREYANAQIAEFRLAMGRRGVGLQKLDAMFTGLFLVVLRVRGGALPAWDALCVEWPMRRSLMYAYGVE